ncbi:BatA domain-containing protein [Christiangramia sp. SM2212]|uniref:BatA domain-containing protein n=1 Tax=Christiangramia sediminicola TaxID=3073267 RepID=A0ABU1ENY8_9FLAO|nr:BatA domain-containing protein [Christiangramia sp. SM2212]MDR5590114.1 BatA domain-containing protein [Christiangramia sp. SM2212]
MHFQHPELLYALLFLIIPLIVHLFRLRRFQREDFTNVKFLKKVIQETRKSSRLKKFLILITRLLLITCLVLAFAQPFIPASDKALTKTKTLIYLDNSFSMQAENDQSDLLSSSINQLLESIDETKEYGLITNDSEYFGRTTSELKKQLQDIEFADNQLNFQSLQLKADKYFNKTDNQEKNILIISDFQNSIGALSELDSEVYNIDLVKTLTEETSNISIDSAFIKESNPENLNLAILLSKKGELKQPVTISIFNGDELLGRNTIQEFSENKAQANFRLQNETLSNGRIEIDDSGLSYDNKLFFNINKDESIKTVIISDADFGFLERIYAEPEFELANFSSDQIDFNRLNSANLVVLNEVEQISSSLQNNLANLSKDGTSILIIPSENALNYDQFLNTLGFPQFNKKIETNRLITEIVYDHPLFQGVFENRTKNFEYPKVNTSFNITSSSSILKYQDGKPFLIGNNSRYLFTSALNSNNSNFQNSPLIVPVLYQIGLNALKKNDLYYIADVENSIDIPLKLGKDEVLHLKKPDFDVIPQQQNFSNRVEINTDNIDLQAGNYEVTNASSTIGTVSFNFDRRESKLNYLDVSGSENINIYDSVQDYFSESNAATQITALWKWFVIFALIFLAIEMLLIKFLR